MTVYSNYSIYRLTGYNMVDSTRFQFRGSRQVLDILPLSYNVTVDVRKTIQVRSGEDQGEFHRPKSTV